MRQSDRMEERYKNETSRMRELGVKFIAGTEMRVSPIVPFDAYVDGLEVLGELGFSNPPILSEAATHQAAIGCGVADRTG